MHPCLFLYEERLDARQKLKEIAAAAPLFVKEHGGDTGVEPKGAY